MIKGIASLNVKLDKLSKLNAQEFLKEATAMVERTAKENCPVGPTADLRNSIRSEYDATEGRVGTNLEYAPYVHQGTGIYAVNGDGRQTPWVYYDESGRYTGTDEAGYVWTVGQQPQPFLSDALDSNQNAIKELFQKIMKKQVEEASK